MGIKGNKDGIVYHVDSVRTEGERLVINGFATCQTHEPVEFLVRDIHGTALEETAYTFTRLERVDISQMLFDSPQWSECGFELTVLHAPSGKVRVELTSGRFREQFTVSAGSPVNRVRQQRARMRFRKENRAYQKLRERYYLYEEHLRAQKNAWFPYEPKISLIVPVYEPDLNFFKQMTASVIAQSYENWEMCVACGTKGNIALSQLLRKYKAEEPRFHFRMLDANEGIAGNTNRALEMATGDVIAFADQDDLLTKDAFYEIVRAMNEAPDADMVYSDEDKITPDSKVCYAPHFKTDFNPDMLYTNNYMSHLSAVKRSLAEQAGGLRSEMDGAQDYDFLLRCTEAASRVVHIPKVLYHWRSHPGSTAAGGRNKEYCQAAGMRAVEAHLKRCRIDAAVSADEHEQGYYCLNYHYRRERYPLLSVVFCGADKAGSLDELTEKAAKLHYEPMEVLMYTPMTGISNAPKGEYILFLNAGAEFEEAAWLEQLMGALERPDVAAAGGCLLRRDGSIYQMGMAFADGEVFPIFRNLPYQSAGYANRNHIQQNLSILSIDFMLVKAAAFAEAGGLRRRVNDTAQSLSLSLNLRKLGYRLVTLPSAALTLSEAAAGEKEGVSGQTQAEPARSEADEAVYEEWKAVLTQPDPYFSPFLKPDGDGNWCLKA